MNENKRLIKNTGLIAIGGIGTKLVSFLLLPLYTALLTTSEYGICDFIISITIFCVPIVSLLMDEAIFRFLIDCKDERQMKIVTTTSVVMVIVGVLVFSVVGIPIMLVLNFKYITFTIILVIAYTISGMLSALLRGVGRTDQFAFYNFMLGLIQVALNVLLIAVFHLGLMGMLVSMVFSQVVVTIVFILKTKIVHFIDFQLYDRILAKKMLSYALPLIPNRVSWNIMNFSDRIILINTMGSAASGLYAVSYKFPSLMDTVYGFFYQSWKESSARIIGDESENNFYNTVYKYLKRFLYALVIVLSAIMPLLFKIMINPKYNEALLYVPILLGATFFSNISGFYGGIFTAYKQTNIMGISTTVGAVINILINFSLIWFIGIYAAAISTLVSTLIVCVYRWIKVRKYVKLEDNYIAIVGSIAVTVLVMYMYYKGTIIQSVIACVIAMVYGIVMNRSLIRKVLSSINKKFNNRSSKKVL